MRYIDESLAPGEVILARGKWHPVFWVMAFAALILFGIIVIGVFIFLAMAIRMWTTDFAVTNQRVILKRGWLTRRTQELAVENIEGVALTQSLLARLFGYGRVIVTGTGEATIVFPPMAAPVAFRRAVGAARAEAHERRIVEDDRAALERARAERANENEAVDEQPAEARPRRRKRGFIGLFGR